MKIFKGLAATALVVAASCGGGTDYSSVTGTNTGTTGGTQTGSSAPVQTNAVGVSDDFFTPVNAQVPVGTTVTWTWAGDATTHNVTFADGVSSGDKNANSVYSRTFSSAGTFSYRCTLHPGMTGSIVVQ